MLFIAYPLSTFYELFRTTELPGYAVPCRRCLSEGVDIFLKSAERQGESGHDVRVSRSAPWMARVGDPVMMRITVSLFIRKFTPRDATSRRDVPFAVGVRGVYGNPTLRAMHSIHKCVAKDAPHLLAVLRNEPRYS